MRDTTGAAVLSFAKDGAGTTILTGPNTYTGATAVNNGTLKIRAGGSLGNTAITVASGATLAVEPGTGTINLGDTSQPNAGATVALNADSIFDMTADAAVGSVNLQQHADVPIGLTIGEAARAPVQFHFDLGGTSATAADLLNVASGVSMPGSAVISINLAAGTTSLTPGDYPLIKSPIGGLESRFTLASSTITVNDVPYTLSLANSTAKAEILTVASSLPANAVWSSLAGGSTLWSGLDNWSGSGRLPPNGAKAQVTFGDAGKQGTVDLGGGTWTVGRITFNGDTGTTLGNATSLVLDNGGTETSATVAVNHAEGVSQTHAITVPLVLNSNLSITVADSHDQLTLGGRIQSVDGARTLTLNGSGKLVLSGGDNNYGDTVVAGGTLEILAANALPPGQDLTIGASGTVVLSSNLSAAATAASHGSAAAVPEPCTLMQLAAGLLAVLAAAAWRWGERITSRF
jgi:autotransporter-associated beta strand protein